MTLKQKLNRIIFGSDTPLGKWFDIVLIFFIVVSVIAVMLDSVQKIDELIGYYLNIVEWFVTIVFTVEFCLRLYCSPKPFKYATSFFGVVDILSVLPSYISLIIPGTHFLMSVRILRVLRVFRILKFVQYIEESKILLKSIRDSFRKIVLFISAIITISIILGSIMYIVEGEANGFTSIPKSIYWAIVTLTTVGYGDISPVTDLGQFISSLIMVLGYSIIVVPTGFVTTSMSNNKAENHCKYCNQPIKKIDN
ncbi:MAG: ion transporter [Candidatus Margulisiibacteriota bacterium]|nr:ion transporter [Candidatus Margulisiibacteriota bacterium]